MTQHRHALAHVAAAALAALAALAPAPARAAGDLPLRRPVEEPYAPWTTTFSVWGGVSRYDVLGIAHGVGSVGAADGRDLLSGNFDTIGGAVVFRGGWLQVGGLYEGSLMQTAAHSEIYAPLLGAALDLSDTVRLDFLAEAGAHHLTQIGSGNAFAAETKAVWLPFVGVRSGVAWRIPLAEVRLVLALTPFARWDLQRKNVEVRTSTFPGATATYQAGGSAFGVVAALGLEL